MLNYEVTRISQIEHLLPGIGQIDYIFNRREKVMVVNLNGVQVLELEGDEAEKMRIQVVGRDTERDPLEDKLRVLVLNAWNVEFDDLKIRTRKREVIEYRQILMWWMFGNTSKKRDWIGAAMGAFDGATVTHACKTIESLKETNKQVKLKISQFEEAVLKYGELNERDFINDR